MTQSFSGILNVQYVPELLKAVQASMLEVRHWQWIDRSSVAKADGTVVTQADLASEAVAMSILKKTGLDVWPEEAGFAGDFKTDLVILFDPIDGTAPLTNGAMTSTVSAALYNHKERRVTACVVGEPASRRIWVAAEGCGLWRFAGNPTQLLSEVDGATRRLVSTSQMSLKSTVYLDLYPTFKKGGYAAVPDAIWGAFFPKVFVKSRVNMFGTNCGHHALVANGDEGAVGAVTTALGGPWDVTPVFLVLEAGGYARAFSTKGRVLEEVPPLQVPDYNLVVSGNSKETVNILSGLLTTHLREYGVVK